MRPERFTPSLLVVLIGSLLLIAGTTAGAAVAETAAQTPERGQSASAGENTTGNVTDEAARSTVEGRIDSLETLSMTVESETTLGNTTYTRTDTVLYDAENERFRTDDGETVTVVNETGTWTYDARENVLSRSDLTFEDRYATATAGLAQLLSRTNVSMTDSEAVNDTTVYRFALEPAGHGYGPATMTVSMNATTELPDRVRVTSDADRFDFRTTATFRNVTVNESIPDERFSIETADERSGSEDSWE